MRFRNDGYQATAYSPRNGTIKWRRTAGVKSVPSAARRFAATRVSPPPVNWRALSTACGFRKGALSMAAINAPRRARSSFQASSSWYIHGLTAASRLSACNSLRILWAGHITKSSNFFAEAATDLELCSFSGRLFEELLTQHPALERALLKRIVADLDAARDWMFMLGRKSAEEKVASFLALISDRIAVSDGPLKAPNGKPSLRLPLSRTEIAECLSLRLETVARQFAILKSLGIVETTRTPARHCSRHARVAAILRRPR